MVTEEAESKVFHAIADGNRRKLLDLLRGREMPVTELASHFDITIAAVSQHLKVLIDADLVERRSKGKLRLYKARPDALRGVHEWTGRYEKFWKRRLRKLGDYLDAEP